MNILIKQLNRDERVLIKEQNVFNEISQTTETFRVEFEYDRSLSQLRLKYHFWIYIKTDFKELAA